MGDQKEAVKVTEAGIELHPGDPELYYLMAKIGIDSDFYYQRAIQIAAADSEEQVFRFNYAAWLHSQGRLKEAVDIASLLSKAPRDLSIFENAASLIADTLHKTRGLAAAQTYLNSIVQNGFRTPLIEENLLALAESV